MTSAITLHHLEASRSHRILWLLEELELPYELKTYARHPETMRAPAELRAVHPLGKAPVVTIDDLVLAESGAILEHFADAHPSLRPEPGTPAHASYRYWLHFAEGSLAPPLLVRLIFDRLRDAPLPFFIKPIVKTIAGKVDAAFTVGELTTLFGFVEEHLGTHECFAGDGFTAADIQMSYPIEAGFARGRLPSLPNCKAWLTRMKARPAYQRATARGAPAV